MKNFTPQACKSAIYTVSMKHNNCPNCKKDIPLSWLLFSLNCTKYRCINCKALMQWASRRKYVGGFVGVFTPVFILLLESYIPSILLRIAIVAMILFILTLAVPKQFELAEDQE